VPLPDSPTFRPELLVHVEPAPVTVTVLLCIEHNIIILRVV